jgi:hypothetical protein
MCVNMVLQQSDVQRKTPISNKLDLSTESMRVPMLENEWSLIHSL